MAWAPDYAEVDDLADFARIPDDVDDVEIALAISAASRAIDLRCHRQFGLVAAPEARYYTPRYDHRRCRWVVEIDDLMTVTGLEVMADLADAGTYTLAIDAFALKPVNAQPTGRPWTSFEVLPASANQPVSNRDSVEVTARFGWTTVPDPVKQACLLQAHRFLTRRNAPFGVAGSPADGSELRLQAKVDPDVSVSLAPFVRWWGAA